MSLLDAFILGAVQGLTEFFPISSSGHLVVAESLLGIHIDPASLQSLNVMLHAGTLLALLLCYAKTWWAICTSVFRADYVYQRLLFQLILASIPAAVVGVLFEKEIANIVSLSIVGTAFLITAMVLWLGERCPQNRNMPSLGYRDIILIGCAQACALVPGLSRSGLTISAARSQGMTRKDAMDFSFLMATPVIAGATMLSFIDITEGVVTLPALQTMLVAIISSCAVSAAAILFLRQCVSRCSFTIFSIYLIPMGILCLMFSV